MDNHAADAVLNRIGTRAVEEDAEHHDREHEHTGGSEHEASGAPRADLAALRGAETAIRLAAAAIGDALRQLGIVRDWINAGYGTCRCGSPVPPGAEECFECWHTRTYRGEEPSRPRRRGPVPPSV